MDGVIVDSNPFHKIALKQFCKKHGRDLSEEELRPLRRGERRLQVGEHLLHAVDLARGDTGDRDDADGPCPEDRHPERSGGPLRRGQFL